MKVCSGLTIEDRKKMIRNIIIIMTLISSGLILGCGPSESQVQKDFERMARRSGVPISGEARVNKMRRVRVDGERKKVWSVNYDVPNGNGTKTWKTTYMTYENGKPKVIRTDTQGWVR